MRSLPWIVFFMLMVGAGAGCDRASADPEVAPGCDEPESVRESEVAAVSNVEVYRGSLDMGGARVIGCLHNRSDETLEKTSLFYKKVGGGGGGGLNLGVEKLEPGQTTAFATEPIDWDEEEGLEGYKFSSVGSGFRDNYDFDKPIELKPTAERPDHKLESTCAGLDSTKGEGDVRLSHLQYEPVKLVDQTKVHVIGCITNRSDEPIATDDRVAKGGYQVGAKHNYESGGGTGDLVVEEPIPAGKSALFVYSNDFDEEKSGLKINPDGGSRVSVE